MWNIYSKAVDLEFSLKFLPQTRHLKGLLKLSSLRGRSVMFHFYRLFSSSGAIFRLLQHFLDQMQRPQCPTKYLLVFLLSMLPQHWYLKLCCRVWRRDCIGCIWSKCIFLSLNMRYILGFFSSCPTFMSRIIGKFTSERTAWVNLVVPKPLYCFSTQVLPSWLWRVRVEMSQCSVTSIFSFPFWFLIELQNSLSWKGH